MKFLAFGLQIWPLKKNLAFDNFFGLFKVHWVEITYVWVKLTCFSIKTVISSNLPFQISVIIGECLFPILDAYMVWCQTWSDSPAKMASYITSNMLSPPICQEQYKHYETNGDRSPEKNHTLFAYPTLKVRKSRNDFFK